MPPVTAAHARRPRIFLLPFPAGTQRSWGVPVLVRLRSRQAASLAPTPGPSISRPQISRGEYRRLGRAQVAPPRALGGAVPCRRLSPAREAAQEPRAFTAEVPPHRPLRPAPARCARVTRPRTARGGPQPGAPACVPQKEMWLAWSVPRGAGDSPSLRAGRDAAPPGEGAATGEAPRGCSRTAPRRPAWPGSPRRPAHLHMLSSPCSPDLPGSADSPRHRPQPRRRLQHPHPCLLPTAAWRHEVEGHEHGPVEIRYQSNVMQAVPERVIPFCHIKLCR